MTTRDYGGNGYELWYFWPHFADYSDIWRYADCCIKLCACQRIRWQCEFNGGNHLFSDAFVIACHADMAKSFAIA